MTPAEAHRLKWSLVDLAETAHQLHQAQKTGDPDEIPDNQHEADNALGRFIGMATIYTTPTDGRTAALIELAKNMHQETAHNYGAVEGAIEALTERTP